MPDNKVSHFTTDSWVYNTKGTEGRIFFRNQVYLPSETPDGLKELRERELQNMRGDGRGRREFKDRIYDYDVFNDLGRPDEDPVKWMRPTVGGDPVIQYPRRCRTGRVPSNYACVATPRRSRSCSRRTGRPRVVLHVLLSNQEVTTETMSVYEVLSSHSPDEEYIGQRKNPNWTASEDVKAAFRRFRERVSGIDEAIRERNADPRRWPNRLGPVRLPYELQRPVSEQGMTGRGIPNSITI